MFNTTAELIREIESARDTYAIRFEPHIYDRFRHSISPGVQAPGDMIILSNISRSHNKCSMPTACMIASTSWGEFQIMGYRLYDPQICDYRDNVFLFQAMYKRQEAAFDLFLKHFGIDFTIEQLRADNAKVEKFAAVYNGDITAYSSRIYRGLA